MAVISFQNTITTNYPAKQKRINFRSEIEFPEFSIQHLLNTFKHIPDHTALLGVVEENIPVMFDLKDPKPGAIMMINDHLPSLRRLMLTMIQSLIPSNSPNDFQYIVISEFPDKWMKLISEFDPEYSYCAGVVGGYEDSAEDWIIYLAQRAEDRINGRGSGASVVLFVDDASQLEKLDIQVRLNYEWLLRVGSKVNIWLVTGFDLAKEGNNDKLIKNFKTRIYGQMDKKFHSKLKDIVPSFILENLKPNRNFATKIGSEWIQFWAPKLQG